MSDALRGSLPRDELCSDLGDTADQTIPELADVDAYANRTVCDFTVDYYSMQYSLLINNVVEVLGGVLFLVTAVYIIRDKLKCDRYIAGK